MAMRKREAILFEFRAWGFDSKGWSKKTRDQYSYWVRRADTWLTDNRGVSVWTASPQELREFLFSTHPTPTTRNAVVRALRGFCQFLIETDRARVNKAQLLPTLPQKPTIPKALEARPTAEIETVARIHGKDAVVLVLLMSRGGLRMDEARTLTWGCVEGEWLSFKGKGAQDRRVPLHPDLSRALALWRLECKDANWVFPSPLMRNRPVCRTWVQRLIKRIGEAAGVEGLHPHKLRHTFATALLDQGENLRTVQTALGHAHPQTTAIYTKVRDAGLQQAIAKLSYSGEVRA